MNKNDIKEREYTQMIDDILGCNDFLSGVRRKIQKMKNEIEKNSQPAKSQTFWIFYCFLLSFSSAELSLINRSDYDEVFYLKRLTKDNPLVHGGTDFQIFGNMYNLLIQQLYFKAILT